MLTSGDGVRRVMSCAWFYILVSSAHRIFYLMISESFTCIFFCKLQACCHVPFLRGWIPSGHSPMKLRLVKCCRDLLSGSPISAKELCSSVRVVIGFQVTSLTKVVLVLLLSLLGWPALGRVWLFLYFFHFQMMETTVLLETFNALEMV